MVHQFPPLPFASSNPAHLYVFPFVLNLLSFSTHWVKTNKMFSWIFLGRPIALFVPSFYCPTPNPVCSHCFSLSPSCTLEHLSFKLPFQRINSNYTLYNWTFLNWQLQRLPSVPHLVLLSPQLSLPLVCLTMPYPDYFSIGNLFFFALCLQLSLFSLSPVVAGHQVLHLVLLSSHHPQRSHLFCGLAIIHTPHIPFLTTVPCSISSFPKVL